MSKEFIPSYFFVEGFDFLRRAELTQINVSIIDDRVSLTVGIPYDVRMTAAEAYTLAHVLLKASENAK